MDAEMDRPLAANPFGDLGMDRPLAVAPNTDFGLNIEDLPPNRTDLLRGAEYA